MAEITENDVWTNYEYSLLCNMCGINESTRDYDIAIAIRDAEAEGFKKAKNGQILCPECQVKEVSDAEK